MSEFQDTIKASSKVIETLGALEADFDEAVKLLSSCVREGGKILVCGNGGSAADAAHFATELLCRFEKDRDSLPGIALTMDGSFLTATGNDYGFDRIFARQIEGLGKAGDVLVGISTSGNSANVLTAFEEATKRGLNTLAMLGRDGGKAAGVADVELIVKDPATARIQEAQKVLIHALCAGMEKALFGAL
ncbi:MAG: SIS domain-containing protein [Verrucomicrobiota bacterium]